jgi:ERCC4-type nuclease
MILVDNRVGSKDLMVPLTRAGLPAHLSHLEYADVAFVGRGEGGKDVAVGIELKRFQDLISSLRTGRLQGHQLPGLRGAYDYIWLIVEGEWRQGKMGQLLHGRRKVHGQMTGGELEKQLLTLEMLGGVHVRHVNHRRDTVRVIGSLYRWFTDRDLDAHRSHLVIYHATPLLPISQFRQTISTLPGVGIKTSLVIERKFITLKRAVNASLDEWCSIDGIGPKTALHIREVLNG